MDHVTCKKSQVTQVTTVLYMLLPTSYTGYGYMLHGLKL